MTAYTLTRRRGQLEQRAIIGHGLRKNGLVVLCTRFRLLIRVRLLFVHDHGPMHGMRELLGLQCAASPPPFELLKIVTRQVWKSEERRQQQSEAVID